MTARVLASCPSCLTARVRARRTGTWVACERCGEEWRADALPPPLEPVRVVTPLEPPLVAEHAPWRWTPNPVTDLPQVARFGADLFGKATEYREGIGSGSARTGRPDHVDDSRRYGAAVAAVATLRRLVTLDEGPSAAVLWCAYGATAGLPLDTDRKVALGFASERLRESWPKLQRGHLAVAWGCERVAPFWSPAPVPREIGFCVAYGFAPASVRKETRSVALSTSDAVSWGKAALERAVEAYYAVAREQWVARGR